MKKYWGEVESTTPSLNRVKVIPVLNKLHVFFCLPWPDMKILEGILSINASWHLVLSYLMDIYKEVRKWIGYFVLTIKVTRTHFSHKNEVSSSNSLRNKLLRYPSPIWTPQGFLSWKDRMEFPFQVTIWPNPPIKSKSPPHSHPNFLILTIKVSLLPYFSLKCDIKV